MPKPALICVCLVLLLNQVMADPGTGITRHLGINQGLSNNSIRCIYQDHHGFMWFGTYDGLNRYDGYGFKIFRNQVDEPASLPHNYINAIGEDRQNNIWVGTGQGMSIYNPLTGKFADGQYLPYGQKQPQRIPFNINAIQTDAKGNLYIATNGGGLLVQAAGTGIPVQLACPLDAGGNCWNNVQSMAIDTNDNVWFFVGDAGLYKYNAATRQAQLVNGRLKAVGTLEIDGQGHLWMGGYDGLYEYNPATRAMGHVYREAAGQLTAQTIASLHYDGRRSLWIGTDGGGIDILDLATQQFTYLLPGEGDNDLSGKQVYAIYQDNESRKWIGTFKGGINIIDPFNSRFMTVQHNPLNPNSLSSNFILSFYEAGDGAVWIGTDGGGISIWNRSRNSFTNYQHMPGNAGSLSFNSVPSTLEDYQGTIWVATFGNGINKFNRATKTFEHYPCFNPAINLENDHVWRLYEDRQHNLWAATYANGRLYKLNREADRFEVFCPDRADVLALLQDGQGTLWGGTVYGLVQVDQQKKSFTTYPITKPVRAIFEDSKKRLWVGTEGGGLVLFDRIAKKIAARFTTKDGLCNNAVLNILEDDKGCLWLSTFSGLSRFNPANCSFKNFYGEDGLQSNQFEYNAALRLRSGEMLFGGIHGFNFFHPASLPARSFKPPVLLTSLRINNTDVVKGSPYISAVQGDRIAVVSVPFDEAVLSFDFAALEYSAPNKIAYAYYLEGWDKAWNYTGNMRSANYTKLQNGTFTLHVKATNAEGLWNPKELQLKVVVLPPWYRSWWAYLLYTAAIAALVYLYLRYQSARTRLKYEVKLAQLESEKEKELAQLEMRKEKELNERKLAFFTDVSHEFRTPLTLIINPVKDMLQQGGLPPATDKLNIVYRNARRLISLIDQLLLFRKADAQGEQLKITRFNYASLCHEVYLCFVEEARSRRIDYGFHCPEEVDLYADRQKIEIVLYNLLSNALKWTPAGGAIRLEVATTAGEIVTTLSDTGAGIPAGEGPRIFERFYQPLNQHAVFKTGVGIGLYLVKSFTESHKGAIGYSGNPAGGTVFTLTLLQGKAHFDPASVVESGLLPETAASAPPVQEGDEPAPPRQADLLSSDTTLLVVEDNSSMLAYIAAIFEGKYKVLQAGNAETGLVLARENLPDLIITDIVMQEMNGMQLCQTIKQDAALGHIPVILLTGSLSEESRLQGIEHGADDFITKPFDKDLLVARVANLLKNRTVLQNYFYNKITLQNSNLKVSEEYKVFLEHCIAIVEAHLDDDGFSIKTLAAEAAMSHSKLYKKVKSVSGLTVSAFIRYIRLRKAAQLLIETSLNVNETAAQVGIHNVKYFREQFHKLFGINPSEYLKKYRKAFGKNYRLNKEAFGEGGK